MIVGLVLVGLGVLMGAEGLKGVEIPKSGFSCEGRPSGYYADVATGCQIYHMCDGIGRQFSYTCPNATLFQQRMLVCDHWYMVNCSKAEGDYSANLLIGQKRPFVEDDNPYSRTPRPDLLSALSNSSEYDVVYRTSGQDRNSNIKNIVGAESEDEGSTGEPTYFPPSRWSTGSLPSTSHSPIIKDIADRRIENHAKAIQLNSLNRDSNFPLNAPEKQSINDLPYFNQQKVNFMSSFKATTPVYPTSVGDTIININDIGLIPPIPYANRKSDISEDEELTLDLLPPLGYSANNKATLNSPKGVNFPSNFHATTPVYPSKDQLIGNLRGDYPSGDGLLPPPSRFVNFESKFKATTPQYPSFVDPTSPDPNSAGLLPPRQNVPAYQSQFKATTPQYPKSVESTSANPYEVGLSPPKATNFVNFESHFKATTPQYPTHVDATSPDPSSLGVVAPVSPNQAVSQGGLPFKFDQPLGLDQEFLLDESELQEQPGLRMSNFMKSFNQSQWHDLRKVFRIPEYDFPLDDATRPSYESIVNSFEPKVVRRR